MARTLFLLIFFLTFGAGSLRRASAQTLVRPQPGQVVVPQSLVPAQPPALPQAPGFVPSASVSATPRLRAGAKTLPVTQPRPMATGTSETAKQPEQTKLARIYRGTGNFDEALAEKLKPMLAKTFGPSNNDRTPVSRMLQSVSGKGDSAPGKDEGPRKIAVAGGL
jgi:hypothetical protein